MNSNLSCGIDLGNLSDTEMECGSCNVCSPTSALVYPFVRDLATSQQLVDELINLIQNNTNLKCKHTEIHKDPDINVFNEKDELICRIEAKYLSGKAFMKVGRILSDKLKPKETLVVDEPKLLSYFERIEKDNGLIPIFIVWKFDRPCKDVGGTTIFQTASKLKEIYDQKGASRRFRRKINL